MTSLSGYSKTIKLHSADALVIHRTQDRRVVILEYEVHGQMCAYFRPVLLRWHRWSTRIHDTLNANSKLLKVIQGVCNTLNAWATDFRSVALPLG